MNPPKKGNLKRNFLVEAPGTLQRRGPSRGKGDWTVRDPAGMEVPYGTILQPEVTYTIEMTAGAYAVVFVTAK